MSIDKLSVHFNEWKTASQSSSSSSSPSSSPPAAAAAKITLHYKDVLR